VVGVVLGAGSNQRTRHNGLGFVNLRSELCALDAFAEIDPVPSA
jgi:hypothetical protein